MTSKCRWLFVFGALFTMVAATQEAGLKSTSGGEQFGPQAVWTMAWEPFYACWEENPAYDDCLVQTMKKNGASEQALAFSKMLEGNGYMSAFHQMGRVNLATAFFPARANTNEVFFMVGGSPSLVSSELDTDISISADPAYKTLKKRYPELEFWTNGASFREMTLLPDGGQHFVFGYPLLNGCHACDLVGYALISHDFGTDGTYRGPSFIRLEPAR